MGRTLSIRGQEVSFNGAPDLGCSNAKWRVHKTTWGTLFGRAFSRNTTGGRSPKPRPTDFGLNLSLQTQAKAYDFCLKTKKVSWFRQSWIAELSEDELILFYDPQVVLLLKRRKESAKPVASFDCATAKTAADQTICTSHELAAWDRSVTQALQLVLKRDPAQEADLLRSQAAFLKARSACGADIKCIDELQWRRVEELRQEAFR